MGPQVNQFTVPNLLHAEPDRANPTSQGISIFKVRWSGLTVATVSFRGVALARTSRVGRGRPHHLH